MPNPLLQDDPRYYGGSDNALAPQPTWADAAQWHAQNLADTWNAMQNPQTWTDAARLYGNALLAGTSGPKEPSLIPAWRIAGRVFASADAGTHQAAWNLMPDEYRSAAINSPGSIQKVFVNENGKVLNRRDAFDYAMDNDLLQPAFVKAFKNAAGDTNPYAELTAEMLVK